MNKVVSIIRWVFGLLFLMIALSSVKSFIFGVPLVILLIPPLANLLWSKVKMLIPGWSKFLLGFILFILMMNNAPQTKSSVQKPTNKPSLTAFLKPATEKPTPKVTETIKSDFYKIVSVIDGDTLQVMISTKKETIRLIGINSPETVDPRKPVECFGKETLGA